MGSYFAFQGARLGLAALVKGVAMALIALFGLLVVHNLQAAAARKVKIEVMEQVAKNNAKVHKRAVKQARLEAELEAEHRQRNEASVAEYDAIEQGDIRACPIERLRCESS